MKDNVPHDVYEQFIRLFVAQEGRLRAFLRTLVPSPDDLDEVMQETSLVACQAGRRIVATIDPRSTVSARAASGHLRKNLRQY